MSLHMCMRGEVSIIARGGGTIPEAQRQILEYSNILKTNIKERYKMRDRFKELPAQEVVRYLIEPTIKGDLERSYGKILEVNKAHVVMLVEQKIITAETGKRILEVTQDLATRDKSVIEIDPNLECLYFNIEAYINKQVGVEIGGQQHTGRSRNDLGATVTKLVTRDNYLKLSSQLNELRATLLQFSQDKLDVIMPGYTHLQPSEPITMAHYFSAILQAFQRDYDRLSNAFAGINVCPLGAGAMAATSWPINRELTASLLGFDTFTRNSLDSVAARDYVLEVLSALSIFMNNLSRLATDLHIWATPEFGYIEIGGSVAKCSSIMPQKKNPGIFEHIKGKASHLEGAFISALNSMKNTPYSHSRDVAGESLKFFWPALDEVEAAINLMIISVKTIKVNKEQMLNRAKNNFCTVTELANYLVRYDGISFRSAHEVVADIVFILMEQKQTAEAIDRKVVSKVFLEIFKRDTVLSEEQIRNALDPVQNVQAKAVTGGPASQEVELQLSEITKRLNGDTKQVSERLNKIAEAKNALDEKVKKIL